MCAGVVYVVLLGSPSGLITLVSLLREIPTIAVLHHPFLFGEIPTWSSRHQRVARYQQALRRYHSRRVHARCFEEGDLVIRCVQSSKGTNKLMPKWEGPYRVVRVTRPGTAIWRPEMAFNWKTHGILSISASSTRKALLSGPARQPPFCTGLASVACNPLYKARRRS